MRISSSVRHVSLLSFTLVLGACAYSTKASFQDITFLSPDAQDAKCLVYANKVKYQVWPPQTINVKKSENTMLVVCHAPGNRTVEVEVPSRTEKKAVWGGPAGVAWDYMSQSLFSYPEVIAIDFSQEELRLFPMPKHNNKDIRQPESYDLEEFLPGDPRLNKDKRKIQTEIKRRGEGGDEWDEPGIVLEGEAPITEEELEVVGDEEAVETPEVPEQAELPQEAVEAHEVLTPIIDDNEEIAVAAEVVAEPLAEEAELPVANSEADSGPVSLVPGE